MDIFCRDPAERGLCRYVEAVATALNVPLGATWCELNNPSSAYIGLGQRLPRYPERDVALLWDAQQGWSMSMETYSGEDLILLGHLTTDLLPNAGAVAAFARGILAGNGSGQLHPPPWFESTDLHQRLAGYAGDHDEHPGIR